MKIAVAGKGGAGKTTVSGTIARALARAGHPVLALDADANPMLGVSLGVGAEKTDLLLAVRQALDAGARFVVAPNTDPQVIALCNQLGVPAVPGAFTPTCHRNHLPGFVAKADEIKAKGVDAIVVTAVNDAFVMDAWTKASGCDGKVEYLADGNGDFAKAIGLSFDASGNGLGTRSKRYSMVVEDGVVKSLNVEDAPGKADVSGAENLLKSL